MAKKTSDGITDETLADPNVQKFLDFIGKAEGADYDVIVGGKKFDDFSKHPGIVGLRTKEGSSTAAGKYQITKTTYNDFAPRLGITDFSPQSQDRIAVAIFQREKALDDIRSGDFESAINKLGGRFASLPSSKYSQPKKSWDFVQAELGTVTSAPSKTQRMAAATQPQAFKVAAGPKAPPKAAKVALTDLPDSYRSALALNFLADSDPEDELMAKATELLQASMPQQGGGPAGGTILQKYAAQMPEVSPYQFLQPPPTDQGPARMAEGGLVVGGTTLPFVPGPTLTQEQMDLIKQREEQYAKYEPLAKEYETQAEAFNRAVDEYNKKAELYNQKTKLFGDVQYATANYGATPYSLGVSYSADENRRKNQMIRDAGLRPGSSGLYDTSFFMPEDDSYVWEQTRDTPGGVLYYGDLYKRGGAYPGEFTQQAPTAPELGFDPAQHEQFVTQAQKDALLRAQALQVASDPGRFNLSGLSAFGAAESPNPVASRRPGVIPRLPRMFQDGGEVAEEPKTDYRITGAVDRINEELADLVRNYRITGTGAERISAMTGLPVADISRMFGATDTSLPSADIAKQELGLERFLDKTPQVMTDEGTRITPGYVLRSVPKDLSGPDRGETLEEYVRRFNIRRSGVNPRTQMFQDGGEVTDVDYQDKSKEEAMRMLLNMRQQIGPVSGQFVPSAEGVDIRASTNAMGLRPFVDFDPRRQDVSQYGASYGGRTPEGEYDLTVSRRMPIETPMGKMDMPVVAQGTYRTPVGKMGEISAQGFYVPRQDQMSRSAYGGNIMYRQRFAEGGEVMGDDLFSQMIGAQPTPPRQTAATPAPSVIQSEVPQVDEFNRVVRAPVQPAPQRSILQELVGGVEAATTVGTGLLSTVPAAVSGYASLLTPGTTRADAEKAMSETMRRFTYTPKGEAGQENVENLGKFLQATKLDAAMPQAQLVSLRVNPGAARYLGDRAVEATERGVMPALRAQTQDPNLQPTDVYRAMADTRGTMLSGPRPIYGGLAPVTEGLLKKGEEDAKRRLGDKPSVVYDGVTYAATPRVLSLIEKAEKIKQNLPPVEQGMTRLWRGNRPGEESQNPSFTNSINGIALPFQEAYGGPLTYVDVPTNKLDTYLTRGAPGSEFLLPPELATKAKIAFAPKQKEQIDRSLLFPSVERPFVGELERRVADLPGPVQKQQFVNSLKGKARDYEIRRVEEALEDFGPTDKLTPNQIMSALKRTSPQRFKLQVLQASDVGREAFSRDYDNPYPARPIGTVNLLLEPGEMQKRINTVFEEIQDFRANTSTAAVFGKDATYIDEYARQVARLADQVDEFDVQLANSVKTAAGDIASEARPIVDLSLARQYVTTPQLDPKNKWLVNWNDPEKTVPQEVKDLLRARGITTLTPEVATMAAKELAAANYLKELKKTINSGSPYATLVRNTLSGYERDRLDDLSASPVALSNATIGLDDFYRVASDPNQARYMAETMQDFATELNGVLRDYDLVLNYGKNEVVKDLRNLTQEMLDSDTLQSGKLYEPLQHSKITGQNPISFARFAELNPSDIVDPPANLKPGEALLFTELQSDRRKDLFEGKRRGIEEPYPGFATDEDTVSELIMKSAVAGAAQLNKKLVLFPGSDSKQPQIYGTWATEEAKKLKDMSQYSPSIMKRVAKKVAKDLGEGYEAREFKTINEAGDEVIRWGIVLPDDASNLPQKGIRFAKGGFVDKPLYDRAQ